MDRYEFHDLRNSKSNKGDTDLAYQWIGELYKQLKHIAVILNELLKVSSSQSTATEHERLGKITYLGAQCETVVGWIDKFNMQEPAQYFE